MELLLQNKNKELKEINEIIKKKLSWKFNLITKKLENIVKLRKKLYKTK